MLIQSATLSAPHFGGCAILSIGRVTHDSAVPRLEMIVGPWYVDDYGNQTRQITARD